MKWLLGFVAAVSSLLGSDVTDKSTPAPLNTAIITFANTYYAPAVAEPGNFPWAKKTVAIKTEETVTKTAIPKTTTVVPPPPPPPALVLPPAPIGAPYLANPEPVTDWYMPTTFQGNSINSENTLPEMTFNREFWRIEVLAYWAPKELLKPSVEKDYFKLEVYEKGTNKLIYTMTSGTEETVHKFQAFKKPGIYYFKTYLKNPSQFEITFTFSGKAM